MPMKTNAWQLSKENIHALSSDLFLKVWHETRLLATMLFKSSIGGFHMKSLFKIRTRSALVAFLLAAAMAMPAWSDTLILRNGATISGTLTSANPNTIMFRDRRGGMHRYSVRDVQSVQFGDAPYDSRGGPGGYGQPGPDRRDGNDQGYRNQNDGGYDQARMERVVLPRGTEVALLTNQRIDSKAVGEGQTFSAQIAENIRDTDGSIAIPRGSPATLITRRLEANGDITLDVDSITVGGRRYRVSTEDQELQNRRDGVGANQRTGQFVGGGAIFGAIIGAIAGGGKGAAVGAVAGAGAGAGAQIITQGKEVHVPAETVLRFRLDRPLRLHLWS